MKKTETIIGIGFFVIGIAGSIYSGNKKQAIASASSSASMEEKNKLLTITAMSFMLLGVGIGMTTSNSHTLAAFFKKA